MTIQRSHGLVVTELIHAVTADNGIITMDSTAVTLDGLLKLPLPVGLSFAAAKIQVTPQQIGEHAPVVMGTHA